MRVDSTRTNWYRWALAVVLVVSACDKREDATVTSASSTAGVTGLAISGTPPVGGGTSQLVATATLANNTTQDVTRLATWSSSDTSILTISPTGLATGVRGGSATAQASYQSRVAVLPMNIVLVAPGPAVAADVVSCSKTIDDASLLSRTLFVPSYPGTSITQVDLGFTSKDTPGSYSVRLTIDVNGTAAASSTITVVVGAARARAGGSFSFTPAVTVPRGSPVRLRAEHVNGPGELSYEGQADQGCVALVTADATSTAQIVGPKIPVRIVGG